MLPNDWTDLESDREGGRRTPGEDTGFAMTLLEDSTTAGRGNGAGVLASGVSAIMITNSTRSAD